MLKKIKGIFIEEDENDKKKAKPSPKLTEKKVTQVKGGVSPPTPKKTATSSDAGATPRAGVVNDKFSNVLFKAMQAADQPGFDYLEFKQALKNLKKVSADEGTRFQSAYAMAQAM
ncbi:MAG: hypothetical protein AAF840_09420, partial [Bacteroidota bacterium]